MQRPVRVWSHVVVVLSVLIVGVLAYVGFIGENHYDEKIEQLHVAITAVGDAGVRVTETIDQDFGSADKHGPQIVIPNDFGQPTDITASSSDAPDDVHVDQTDFSDPVQGTRIRVGDPDTTISGQHRYVISYTLPAARYASPTFTIDAVGFGPLPIEDVTVVVTGIELADPECFTGPAGATEPCQFRAGAPLRTHIDKLDPNEGITLRGEVTGWTSGDAPDAPAAPPRRPNRRATTALWAMAIGAVTAGAVYLWSVRKGGNEVIGSSPAEAAHGSTGPGPASTRKVSDAELAEMTTIEFAPPKGIEPWQGAVVLDEVLNDASVTAWFSGAVADGILEITQHDGSPRLTEGPNAGSADPVTAGILRKLFANREVVDLDGYDAKFGAAWSEVERLQDEWVAKSGWWWSGAPKRGRPKPGGCATFFVLVTLLIPLVLLTTFLAGLLGFIGGVVTAVLFAFGLPYFVARVAYAPLRPGRTANGSAYALQVGSFRRFLVESEGQYVEWAWQNGLLRQYSAWAVALDAADAWQAAMERAGVPPAEVTASSTPLLVHSMAHSFTLSHTPPSTSSSSGGSSFSSSGGGGFSGGGGGGGSHGSW